MTITTHPAKTRAIEFVERNQKALAMLSDWVFYFGDLGMQEHKTSALMCDLLEEAGFNVTRGLSGFPTAFMATYGKGDPVKIGRASCRERV